MELSLNSLAPAHGSRTKSFRVGRGNASGRGTTAGRGTKGQRARTGGRNRLKLKGAKQMLLAFPKLRGFTSKFPTVYAIPVERLMASCDAGERVDIKLLKKKGLVPRTAVLAKVIGGGEATKKLTLVGIKSTAAVKEALIKAGTTFVELPKAKKTKGSKANAKK